MNKAQKMVAGFFAAAFIVVALLMIPYLKITSGTVIEFSSDQTILYYGETCPHCRIVEEFMANNSIESKMEIIQKEAFANKTNGEELLKAGEFCKIQGEYLGAVPLLYDGSGKKCYLGDKDIISFFQEKLNITSAD